VARLDDPRAAPTYARLGIQTIATTTWGIHRLTELLCYASLAPSVSLGDGAVDLIDVAAPPLLVGRTLDAVTVPGQAVVVAISRGGATFLPTAGAIVQAGDRLHLAVAAAAADRLTALLGLA
jgi:trk system potassium uptake protein TrkA